MTFTCIGYTLRCKGTFKDNESVNRYKNINDIKKIINHKRLEVQSLNNLLHTAYGYIPSDIAPNLRVKKTMYPTLFEALEGVQEGWLRGIKCL